MYPLLILIFIVQFVTIVWLYFTDRELKFAYESGIKQVKMITLSRSRHFFVYYRRKEGVISKYVFVCMIALYITDFVGLTAISIQFIIENDLYLSLTATMDSNPSLMITVVVFTVISGVLFVAATGYELSFEQKNELREYISKELKRLK